MARKNFDSTDYLKHMNYAWPTCGKVSVGTDSVSFVVALATIEATDTVIVSMDSQGATVALFAYPLETVITAGTGFTTTLNASALAATLSYAVFKTNS